MSQEANTENGFTGFFREMHILNTAVNLTRVTHTKRIVSLGCSTGEEVYSLGLLTPDDIQIEGIDAEPDRIAKAQTGQYTLDPTKILEKKADTVTSLLRLFANPKMHAANSWEVTISETTKMRTKFAVHDIIAAPIPDPAAIMVCVNVFMHYSPSTPEQGYTAQKLERNVYRSVEPGGFLITDLPGYKQIEQRFSSLRWRYRGDLVHNFPAAKSLEFYNAVVLQRNPDKEIT